jgi:hypothetical protein
MEPASGFAAAYMIRNKKGRPNIKKLHLFAETTTEKRERNIKETMLH